jgi:integrase
MPQNKDGYFRSTFVIGKDAAGKPKRITVRGKTKRELEEKLAEAKRMYGLGLSMGETTVYDWAERWLRIYKANASQTQKAHYKTKLENDILPHIGEFPIRNIRASHLQEILNEYKGGKLGTVQKIRQAIKQLFDDAELEGIIERNPARRLELPELVEETRRPLTLFKRTIVYTVAQTHERGVYILTMLFCGLRRGETLILKVGDIDFEGMKITINKSLSLINNDGVEKGTKSKAGVRVVPIPNLLLPLNRRQNNGRYSVSANERRLCHTTNLYQMVAVVSAAMSYRCRRHDIPKPSKGKDIAVR